MDATTFDQVLAAFTQISGVDYPPSEKMTSDLSCVLVRAVAEDPEQLLGYAPPFETTHHPIQLLWGPGSVDKAHACAQTPAEDDKADILDRHFAIRRHGGLMPPDGTARNPAQSWSR